MLGDVFSYLTDGSNWSGSNGMGAFLVQQLLLTVTAMVVAMVVGLPLAMYAGHRHRFGFLAVNVSNVGRAVPVFAVLLVLSLGPVGSEEFGPYGRAGLATLISLVLFALPPLITNTYVGITLVQAWATATIAALVAGPGLGRVITRGFANHRTYEVVAGAVLVAVIALILEGLAVLGERFADPMRRAQRGARSRDLTPRDELLPDAVV
jgi:osmoprotectant transport system permease protein